MIATQHWTAGVHHDGSIMYVSNPTPRADEIVTIKLRVPLDSPVQAVFLRTAPDGESHLEPMEEVGRDGICRWYAASLRATMPVNTYRFKLMTAEGAYYLTAAGISRAERTDALDFKLLADFDTPSWLNDAVFYQIFPDRFYNGDDSLTPPNGAWERGGYKVQQRDWGLPPLHWHEGGGVVFYGGDLLGITQKLDYLETLGVNALYLCPIFCSESNHRYDITDFYHVDPHLGGDEGLIALRRALDAKGMRLVLDITPNHCSYHHPWFTEALKNPAAPTREYFIWNEYPNDYATWLGVPSLIKLNYDSPALREVMYRGDKAIIRHWMREPYRIDGWRLDVLNMTGRYKMRQLGHEVAREIRQAVKEENPQAYLVGEHFHDGTPYLQGDQLDATMNYQGFNVPMRRWLGGHDLGVEGGAPWGDTTLLPAEYMAQQMQRFYAAVPWAIARLQFNQLGSHDVARILTVVDGDSRRAGLAAVMLMAYPGVPCVYYGDEIGIGGGKDPDNRRTMLWDESQWDKGLYDLYRQAIHLRRTQPALIHGGFQILYAEQGIFAFMRQSPEQRLIIVGYRGLEAVDSVCIPIWHGGTDDHTVLRNLLGDEVFSVENGVIRFEKLETGAVFVLEG